VQQTKYKCYKNTLTTIIRAAEKNYYANKLIEIKDSSSKTWQLLNQMTSQKCSNTRQINEVNVNDSIIKDPQTITEKFNKFFSNVGSDLAAKIPSCNKKPTEFLKGDYLNSMYFAPTEETEVKELILNLKNSTSRGYDNIQMNIIKSCSAELSPILSYLKK
ncbi:MAG: hypothetical protein WAX04_06660, partial [Oscillospiraceae bacterium]